MDINNNSIQKLEDNTMQDFNKMRRLWESVEEQIDNFGKTPLTEAKAKKGVVPPQFKKKGEKDDKKGKCEEDTGAEAINGAGNKNTVPTKLGKKAKKEGSNDYISAKGKKKFSDSDKKVKKESFGRFREDEMDDMEDEVDDIDADIDADIDDIDDIDATGDAGLEMGGDDLISRIKAAYPGLEVMVTVKGEIPPELSAAAGETGAEIEDEIEDELGDEDLDGEIEDELGDEDLEEEGQELDLERFMGEDEDEIEDEIDDVEDVVDDMEGAVDDVEDEMGEIEGDEVSLSLDQWESVLGGEGSEEEIPVEPEMGGEEEFDDMDMEEESYVRESFRLAKKAGNLKRFKEAMRVASRHLSK